MPRRLARSLLPLVALLAAPAAEAKPGPKLTVMTRNIYLGGNIALPIPATSRADFEQRTTQLWQQVQATDFPARAKLLAREVRRTKPDVIGLQEVALWRRGPDGLKDAAATPSTTVVYDFLATLRRELGSRYRLGSVQKEADIEAPTSLGYDVRLTMRDAVLVRRRKGLRIRRRLGANYAATFDVPTQVGTLQLAARLDGDRRRRCRAGASASSTRTWRRSPTPSGSSRRARSRRARCASGARSSSSATSTPTRPAPRARSPTPTTSSAPPACATPGCCATRRRAGNNCCLKQETITDPPPGPFDHRVDHILAKGRFKVLRTRIVGTDPANRTAAGLWPSDHGGGATTLRLR